jgi:hypothetical protein
MRRFVSLFLSILLSRISHRANAAIELSALTAESPVIYSGTGAYYNKKYDICGLCDGDATGCQGCDRNPNSRLVLDACGRCGNPFGSSFLFNATCSSCRVDASNGNDWQSHGSGVIDDCGGCVDPTDQLFSRQGGQNYFTGGCIGCDGVANSANELDGCGVCSGMGCAPEDLLKRSWCCDCAGTPFGPHLINFCCECVNREPHWKALSGSIFNGPPASHAFAEHMWSTGQRMMRDVAGLVASFQLDLSNRTGTAPFARAEAIYQTHTEAKEHFTQGWRAMRDPLIADDNSSCYNDIYVASNVSNPRDICGVCHGDNSSCAGCVPTDTNRLGEPIPIDGLFLDDCIICGGSNLQIDECGVCFGDNRTCIGCDGIPNSGKLIDGCAGSSDFRFLSFIGEVGDVGSGCSEPAEFLEACDAGEGGCCGCDGVPNSGKTFDGCFECLDQKNSSNAHLVNASCSGCDGIAFSGELYDHCCICSGSGAYDHDCYNDVLVDKTASVPFDPYSMNYVAYFTPLGRRLFDECGECQGLGYNGSTCIGCDGVHGSGLVVDGCGVCGGDCSTCTALETGLPYDCISPGNGWTGMDKTCEFVRTQGPDKWINWSAFSNGTDGKGHKAITWYERVNHPGVPRFTDHAKGECRMFLEPPPPPGLQERREWVVKVYGKEEGPYSIHELESGSISVIDSTTGDKVNVPLLPTTLVSQLTSYTQKQTIHYGYTSQYQARVQGWKERSASRIVDSPGEPGVDNAVIVEGHVSELWNGGVFMPIALMPGMERIIYPYCTGSTWRGNMHRLHGKKLPGNSLGLITSENITDTDGLLDRAWNPLDEYIYDVSGDWIDQKCTCSREWQYDSQPIVPTCPKVWFPWEGQTGEGWPITHNKYANDTERFTIHQKRSWQGGSWRVSGGWWVQDYGGRNSAQQVSQAEPSLVLSRSGNGFGSDAMRGPVRLDAGGTHSLMTFSPVSDKSNANNRDLTRNRTCYSAARLSQAKSHTAGALWGDKRENVKAHWECSFGFILSEPTERCEDVYKVSRSFSEAVHTHMHRKCSLIGGDGFAFVIRDDKAESPSAADVGDHGPGIGYQGLRHSLAVEFDTWHNPENFEPFGHHIAVHTNGANPNDAHHDTQLGFSLNVPNITDGDVHIVRISFEPTASYDHIIAALESGNLKGSTQKLGHFVSDDLGILSIFVDEMDIPVLTVPLSMGTILRPNHSTAWIGFTSGTGEAWQAVDILSWNFSSFSREGSSESSY